ncbi:flavodoxin domain-containing protein [Ruegeria meonggei]|uniref:Protoporphyrinogen IX dehydrogenase [menaquinone] n=1 Tax=Ruegeria meonggei TaxID=1446476 RepID=A0A1X7AD70_9RHOB|nr:flavodoxin domain-containing protein [Ruegeria meonggei]SLN76437.1 Protoporphyrinogen IX dehydrogenase [menaquinone] [Ruegeria meonggei]
MTVLIAYGTIEGQTAKISRFINKVAFGAGYETRLIDVDQLAGPVSLEDVDHVILAAPVHERRHPKPFEEFLERHHDTLSARRSLLLSVSLKAAFQKGQEDARDYLTEMLMRTNFEPDATALVAGAVRPDSYGYFEREIVQHVVMLGQKIDPRDGLREFTDWDALKTTVTAFLGD